MMLCQDVGGHMRRVLIAAIALIPAISAEAAPRRSAQEETRPSHGARMTPERAAHCEGRGLLVLPNQWRACTYSPANGPPQLSEGWSCYCSERSVP
jgi:hypothetical protein